MDDSPCKKPGNADIKQMAQELEDEEAQKVLSNDNIKRILKKKGVTL